MLTSTFLHRLPGRGRASMSLRDGWVNFMTTDLADCGLEGLSVRHCRGSGKLNFAVLLHSTGVVVCRPTSAVLFSRLCSVTYVCAYNDMILYIYIYIYTHTHLFIYACLFYSYITIFAARSGAPCKTKRVETKLRTLRPLWYQAFRI